MAAQDTSVNKSKTEKSSSFRLESLYKCSNELKGYILEYLVYEGYADAAKCFEDEIQPDVKNSQEFISTSRSSAAPRFVDERQNVRKLILDLKFKEASDFISLTWPKFFDKKPAFLHRIRHLEVMQLFHQSGIEIALRKAQDYFSPIICKQPRNLEAMHWIENSMMALLRMSTNDTSHLHNEPDPLSPSELDLTASSVNRAIVEFLLQEALVGSSDETESITMTPDPNILNSRLNRQGQAYPQLTSLVAKVLYFNHLGNESEPNS